MKQIKLAVLMDDITSINPIKDSSFAMMLEAQSRGWNIITFDSNDMFHQQGSVYASARKTTVEDSKDNWHHREDAEVVALGDIDVIFMRKDPPFDMDYIYATYLLEQAERDGTLIVNKPSSLRDANEKLFTLNFNHCMPKTLVSANTKQIRAFVESNDVAVVKPLDGMGGTDIYKLHKGDDNIDDIVSKLTNQGQRFIMAQEFLHEIKDGDKRILLINGKPVDYALARIPAEGNFKGNLAAGATGRGQPLSDRDRYLCEQIAPTLIEKGLLFVGLDVIGDYITEINVTSPTCIRELDKLFNLNISALLLDEIEAKLALR
ncbi:MAG: glutathione synthase [Gammaproteobacteria bacterium]|nr:glutathione synthase [Gammaproteobacteria bacterium]